MTKREWQLAIPILVSFSLCLAAFVYGQHMVYPNSGIAALRVFKSPQGERVAVVANSALHLLDPQGKRLARQDIKTLGLTETPNDMDWTVDDQQRVEAWFFDDATTPRVVRCAWSNEQAQLVDCRTAMSGAQLKSNSHSLAVHIAVDRAGQRVFIADAKGARVQSFDLEGKPLVSTNPQDVPLSFPNRLRYLGNDTLVVADNDHRRVAWLQVTPGQPPKLGRTLASADHGQARKGRGKVTDAAFGPDGTVWMLAMKQGQKDGDVLVFDAQQRPVARAALSDDSDPIIIEALSDNTTVAADYSLVKLHHIDAQGRDLGEFGDAAFRSELQPLQGAAQAGALWQRGAMVAGGVTIALGLMLGLLFGQKPKRPGQFDSQTKAALAALAGRGDGDHSNLRFPLVLRQTDAYKADIRKQIQVLALLALFLPIVLMVVPSWVSGDWTRLTGSWRFLGLALAAAAVPVIAALVIWRMFCSPGELRVTENNIGWFRGDKMVSSTPLAHAYASTNAVLVGYVIVRFRMAAFRPKAVATMFDMDLFNRAVLARLPTGHLVDDQVLAWKAVKNRPMAFRVALCMVIVLGIMTNSFPLFRRGLGF